MEIEQVDWHTYSNGIKEVEFSPHNISGSIVPSSEAASGTHYTWHLYDQFSNQIAHGVVGSEPEAKEALFAAAITELYNQESKRRQTRYQAQEALHAQKACCRSASQS